MMGSDDKQICVARTKLMRLLVFGMSHTGTNCKLFFIAQDPLIPVRQHDASLPKSQVSAAIHVMVLLLKRFEKLPGLGAMAALHGQPKRPVSLRKWNCTLYHDCPQDLRLGQYFLHRASGYPNRAPRAQVNE